MTHFQNLLRIVPDLANRKILDVGCGYGRFVKEAKENGASALGVDISEEKIRDAVTQGCVQGLAEKLPFENGVFDFVNMCEVVEHVEDPVKTISEAHRVLQTGGLMYVSIPNRFGIKDPHYRLFFINFLPRKWTRALLPTKGESAGRQSLADMHYYTYRQAQKLLSDFEVRDSRTISLKGWKKIVYVCIRPLIPTFHFLCQKVSEK